VLQAADLSLREEGVHRVRAPAEHPDRGVRRARAAGVDHVRRGLRGRRGHRVVARREAHEALGVDRGVAVEHDARHLLVHAFQEGHVFGQAELGGVAVQVGDVLVDRRCRSRACRSCRPPGRSSISSSARRSSAGARSRRQARAHGGLVPGRQVAFDDEHVVQDSFDCESRLMIVATLPSSSMRAPSRRR
jgi:hypothetical protein